MSTFYCGCRIGLDHEGEYVHVCDTHAGKQRILELESQLSSQAEEIQRFKTLVRQLTGVEPVDSKEGQHGE